LAAAGLSAEDTPLLPFLFISKRSLYVRFFFPEGVFQSFSFCLAGGFECLFFLPFWGGAVVVLFVPIWMLRKENVWICSRILYKGIPYVWLSQLPVPIEGQLEGGDRRGIQRPQQSNPERWASESWGVAPGVESWTGRFVKKDVPMSLSGQRGSPGKWRHGSTLTTMYYGSTVPKKRGFWIQQKSPTEVTPYVNQGKKKKEKKREKEKKLAKGSVENGVLFCLSPLESWLRFVLFSPLHWFWGFEVESSFGLLVPKGEGRGPVTAFFFFFSLLYPF
jgi:hypothetical protein